MTAVMAAGDSGSLCEWSSMLAAAAAAAVDLLGTFFILPVVPLLHPGSCRAQLSLNWDVIFAFADICSLFRVLEVSQGQNEEMTPPQPHAGLRRI